MTSAAITTGVTLTSGYLKRGTNEIKLDWAARQLSVGGETYGSAGVQARYNGSSGQLYAGNGGTKYIEYDGTDVVLGEDTRIRGIGNSADYAGESFVTYFESLDGWDKIEALGGTVAYNSSNTAVELATTTTNYSTASIGITRITTHTAASWGYDKIFSARIQAGGTETNRTLSVCAGGRDISSSTSTSIGFEMDYSKTTGQAWIRGGCTHFGVGGSYTSYYGSKPSGSQFLSLTVKWFAATATAYFYVDGVLIGSVTDASMASSDSHYLVGAGLVNGASVSASGAANIIKMQYWQSGT